MHQNTSTAANPTTVLGRIGRDPSRLMTVREWWHENEPLDLVEDPEAVFADDEGNLIALCRQHGVDYCEAGEGREAAFPVWLMTGYQVAWKETSTGLYTAWNTDNTLRFTCQHPDRLHVWRCRIGHERPP